MSIESFAALIRLREVLVEKEWLLDIRSGEAGESEADIYGLDEVAEKKMESLIISMEVFCFKQNLSVKQFIDILNELYWAADRLDIPLENFPGYIEQLKAEKDSLIDQIQQIKLEEKLALEGRHTTERKLEEYWNDRPLVEKNQQLKQKLEEVNKERDMYKKELEQVRFWERKKENMMWAIPEDELNKAAKDLNYSKQVINPQNLKNIVMDIFSHPSKYTDAIKLMIERYRLEHKERAD